MMTYIEYKNKIAFHPGYYINQYVEDSELSQEEFAKRLGTTPKNLSILINGEQTISLDIATKLSKLLGTSIEYWLNLQQSYDLIICEMNEDKELEKEKEVYKLIDYNYFADNYNFPKKINIKDKISLLRKFLNLSSLSLLLKRDITIDFRSCKEELTEKNIVNANIMMQIAINDALNESELPPYNKIKFKKSVEYALTLKENIDSLDLIKKAFHEAGVVLVTLPNIKGSGINGGTRKINGKRVIMINDRRHYVDTLWFTLFHEVGHVLQDEYSFVFDNKESLADSFAIDRLIPKDKYESFIFAKDFTLSSIKNFSKDIKRDSGIVLGRLMMDGFISFNNNRLNNALREKISL